MDEAKTFFHLLFWGISAFFISILMELLLKPRPGFRRPFQAWLCQFGLFSSLYAIFLLLSGRPVCSCGATSAIFLVLVLVSNAKYASLREPFLYQDYDYFLDVIRFPRLYLPFLGIRNFSLCVLGCVVAIAGLMLEEGLPDRFSFHGQLLEILLILAIGLLSLSIGALLRPKPAYLPSRDYSTLGFPAFLFLYGLECRKKITLTPSFMKISHLPKNRPHLIAIQSESFFDPRIMDPELDPIVLENFDKLRAQSLLHGFLKVPAWGANTVRTEFSFLTGMDARKLGPHQFNPYRAMCSGWIPENLPSFLKTLGYETICLHPWHAAFYGRKRLFPKLGFDRFLDLSSFADCRTSGAYTDDRCLADKLLTLLRAAETPLFAFIITMENHGPLQEEKNIREKMRHSPYRSSWPDDCPELPIYIHHLHHGDLMLGKLHAELSTFSHPASLCLYGDHVPIMPRTYELMGYPEGDTPYFCWNNYREACVPPLNMPVYDLAKAWLNIAFAD